MEVVVLDKDREEHAAASATTKFKRWFHYECDGIKDTGWGCVFRSF